MWPKRLPPEPVIALVAALFFIPFLGRVHLFDWDEINFAECAREMFINGEYGRVYINFQPFWEKPPFFFWLQTACMHLFGVGEFAARFPNALCGIITLLLLYRTGAKLYNRNFGLLWAGLYIGSILPHFYFRSGLIDPWFNLFIFIAILNLVRYVHRHNYVPGANLQHSEWRYLLIGGLSAGMAVITKGPVALLLIGLSFFVYWVLQRFRMFFSIGHILAFGLSSLLASALLYGIETIKNGPWFITEFIKYNYRLYNIPDAGHGGFPGYHFVVLLVGCFPASLFCIRAMGPMPAANPVQSDFRRWMIILFWVVLIVFTIVKSKIVHYSSLCYFPLTFLAAVAIYEMVQGRMRFPKWIKIGTGVLGILIGIVPLILPYMAQHKEQYLRPLLSKDPFALKNLDAEVHWTGTEWLVGVFVIAYIITVLLLWKRQRLVQGFTLLLGGTAFTVMFILWGFIGRVELFSQGAAISFFESLAGKDVYVIPFGYRTYAHYFYPKLQPENKPKFYYAEDKDRGPDEWREFLLTQPQPKDVYVISKINKTDGLEKYPALKKIGEQNGFVFYKKEKG